MNITFFIGNGFDLNLGLKTKYSDFYPYFMEKSAESNMIRRWLKNDELLWADLEEELGQKLENLKEGEQDKFYEDKDELDELLLEYLEQEQIKFSIQDKENEIVQEFTRSLSSFYIELPEVDREDILSILEFYANEEFKYCFISFNYTDTLDRIIDITNLLKSPIGRHRYNNSIRNNSIDKLVHIHGTIIEEMILGVNDIDQVNNNFLKEDEEFLDTFIKSRMNDSLGQRKIEHVKDLIDESHIICIFGMSLGSTDKMWRDEVISWLHNSNNNRLIIFYKDSKYELNKRLPSQIIRLNNRLKKEIFRKFEIDKEISSTEDIRDQIFIIYNANIFSF